MECRSKKNPQISIAELRAISNAIFDHIENTLGIKSVELKKDYYYQIANNYRYDMSADPPEYAVGQLIDDLDLLNPIKSDSTLATPLHFMHLAPLLDYLATEINWYNSQLKR